MHDGPTNGIVHDGFRGLQSFLIRKIGRCKLIGNHLVLPHDTIPPDDKSASNILTKGNL